MSNLTKASLASHPTTDLRPGYNKNKMSAMHNSALKIPYFCDCQLIDTLWASHYEQIADSSQIYCKLHVRENLWLVAVCLPYHSRPTTRLQDIGKGQNYDIFNALHFGLTLTKSLVDCWVQCDWRWQVQIEQAGVYVYRTVRHTAIGNEMEVNSQTDPADKANFLQLIEAYVLLNLAILTAVTWSLFNYHHFDKYTQ